MYGRTCGGTEIPVEAGRCVSRGKSCQSKNDERGMGLESHLSQFGGRRTDRRVSTRCRVACLLFFYYQHVLGLTQKRDNVLCSWRIRKEAAPVLGSRGFSGLAPDKTGKVFQQ